MINLEGRSASGNLDSAVNGRQYSPSPVIEYMAERYDTFAGQFLEPIVVPEGSAMGFSVTVCTWRGIPTIDDW